MTKVLNDLPTTGANKMPKAMGYTWGCQWAVKHTGLGGTYLAFAECVGAKDDAGIMLFVQRSFTIPNSPAGGQEVDIDWVDGAMNPVTLDGVKADDPASHGRTISTRKAICSADHGAEYISDGDADTYLWQAKPVFSELHSQWR